jgi:hypothetical protein
MESSKIRLQLVFPAMLTQISTLAHWGQIVPRVTILQIGIRQVTIYHILNPEPMRVEAASITAELPAANVIHPLFDKPFVPSAMMKVLKIMVVVKEEVMVAAEMIKLPLQKLGFYVKITLLQPGCPPHPDWSIFFNSRYS